MAPAVLQVFALLRLAGGLWLLSRPRSDSVHGLQQRRLTSTDRNLQRPRDPSLTNALLKLKAKKKKIKTKKIHKHLPNLSLALEHSSVAHSNVRK